MIDMISIYLNFLKRFYCFLERGGGEKDGERNINVWLPLMRPPLGARPATQACALDWESNQRPFGLQDRAQSTELHQPGLNLIKFIETCFVS